MECCWILPPRPEDMIGPRQDGYMPECLLPKPHYTPHVFKTPEGKYIAWEDDMECGCCEPDEDDRCAVFWQISKQEFEEMCTHPLEGKQ
jgi:hypothetical protein